MLGTNFHKKRFLLGWAVMLLALFTVFSGCFSPWRGDTATITLYLGDASDSRNIEDFDPPAVSFVRNLLNYDITLISEKGIEIPLNVLKGAHTVQVSVAPGTWNILVRAYLLPEDLEHLFSQDGAATGGNNIDENEKMYQWSYAGASVSKEIKAGQNTVEIQMLPYYFVTFINEGKEEVSLEVFVLKGKTVREGKTMFGRTVTNKDIDDLWAQEPSWIQSGLYEGTGMPTFTIRWMYWEWDEEGDGGGTEPGEGDGWDQGEDQNVFDFNQPILSNMDIYADWEGPSPITEAEVNGQNYFLYSLDSAIEYINRQGGDYTYLLYDEECPITPAAIGSASTTVAPPLPNLTLIGIGDEPTIITFSSGSAANGGSLFNITSGASLTLGKGITLQGKDNNYVSLVNVSNGTLTMEDGSKITGNNISQGSGGGVYVSGGGTFYMNGGIISGNTAAYGSGGGVYIDADGSFVMDGGTISENNADNGGGVYVNRTGNFTMTNGYIRQNVAATYGGGVYVVYISGNEGFNKIGGIIYGSPEQEGNSANDGASTTAPSSFINSPGHAVVVSVVESYGLTYYGKNKTVAGELNSAGADQWTEED